jgi:hypothetical protein
VMCNTHVLAFRCFPFELTGRGGGKGLAIAVRFCIKRQQGTSGCDPGA